MNKFFTLILSSLLFAGSAHAGSLITESIRQTGNIAVETGEAVTINGLRLKTKSHSTNVKKAPAGTSVMTDVITEVKGRTQYMTKTPRGYVLRNEMILEYGGSFATDIVYGDNNDVYFLNPMSMVRTDTYVRGTIEGDRIVVELPQTVLKENLGTDAQPVWEGFNLSAMKLAVVKGPDGNETLTYVIDEDVTSVYYTIDDDGTLTLGGLGRDGLLGLSYCSDGEWTGDGDLSQEFVPYNRELVTLPEGIKLENYALVIGQNGFMIKAGFTDDAVYLVGLLPYIPDGVVKADIKDGIASISQHQLVGLYDTYFITTRCGVFERKGSKKIVFTDGPYEMTFDDKTKEFSAVDPDKIFIFNAAENTVKDFVYFMNLAFRYQDSMSGTPSNPTELKYREDDYFYNGFYTFQFNVPNVATNGNVIDLDNMYYSIFIDGEIMEFSTEEGYYPGIPDDEIWDELPCTFSNGFDINGNGTTYSIGLYPEGITTIGVQIYYYNGKERTESAIMTLNLENGKVTNDVDTIHSNNIVSTTYYDLQGCRVENPAGGIFIRHDTLDNGDVIVSKTIRK